jgi:hypothetical protein
MKVIFFLGQFVFFSSVLSAQINVKENNISIPMINLSSGFHIPGEDLADRFGQSSSFGIGFQLKKTSNFYWGYDIMAISGATVKEDNILNIITADSIDVIDANGHTASIRFWQRGAQVQAFFGKIISFIGPNPNSGIFIQGGLGMLYHQIRIEDIGNNSPQINQEMLKGYDRLCIGFSLSQFIGYRHFSNNQKINFFVGIELIQAFTEDVRMYDYNDQSSYEDKRIDLLSGLKFGWTFPLYKKSDNKYYYY